MKFHMVQLPIPGRTAEQAAAFFEVNIWMWRYERAFPRKILVNYAKAMRRARVSESRRRGAATLKRRRLAAAERQQE
jgi:hypothetical protein